jgi:hypothetical protein
VWWRCFGLASALVAAAEIEAIVKIASAARFNILVTCLESGIDAADEGSGVNECRTVGRCPLHRFNVTKQ